MVTRKRTVYQRIKELPEGERQRARFVYSLLDDIEWNTIAPYYFGAFVFLALPFIISVAPQVWDLSRILPLAVFLYAIGVFVLKQTTFNVARYSAETWLRYTLLYHPCFRKTLDLVLELDPDIERTIKKPLSHAIAAAKQPHSHYSDIS